MIQSNRLIRLFTQLVAIDSATLGERNMCDAIKRELISLGIEPQEDQAGAAIGGNCGNLYAYVAGSLPLPPILLCAHMDTVEPSRGKRAVLQPDGRITSDGTTVLGADDLSGVCAILEALRSVRESGAAHRPVELLFTVAEETYCTGIRQLDFSRIRSREAYVFDLSGPVGRAALQAPTILSFRAEFHGRAAHAAFSPEKGIHAIRAAADAVAAIPCGRSEDTTVNIGTIRGGSAANVVPESCTVTGEVRSFQDQRARDQLDRIRRQMEHSAETVGAVLDFHSQTHCIAYQVDASDPAAARFRSACGALGLEGALLSTYGGSDNNHLYRHGIHGLVAACGMNSCHSCEEYTSVPELENAAKLAQALILSKE